ncbi:MAG: tRNA adenosine(34) deaminase TadA [Desulfurispora sp.]|uniref:tRNA adenosine(34) deaminase TadA n=1 Tax=Desulfurispora sp. TaxID=3014275 RepID=UPI00404B7F1F
MLAANHAYWMRCALQEAALAAGKGEVPIGAVVVKNGTIIGRGHNLRETLKDASAHAEILALRQAAQTVGDWRLNGATIYSTIEPCPMCAGALVQFRVDCLVYGARDPKAGAVDSLYNIVRDSRLNHRLQVVEGVLAEECAAIIREFFRTRRAEKKAARQTK